MDPLRTDAQSAEALSGAEREARIEQLLLAGLDEYFAHRYEHAISLWTRVLFFERHHDRARAYIERARSAQAERQRESDAALQQGIDAFRAGDVVRARALVADAIARGASPDEAHGVMERIERLGVAQRAPRWRRRAALVSTAATASSAQSAIDGDRAPHSRGWLAALLLVAAGIGILAVGTWGLTIPEPWRWPVFSADAATTPAALRWTPEPLPIPAASETYLARAQTLAATGRLHDALRALDRIPIGDPLYRDATRLRADVQERLLPLAHTAPTRE
jgi:hypothetical protein